MSAAGDLSFHAKETARIDLADYIVRYFEAMGVEFVFGIPGGAIEPLYNALARRRDRGGIASVLARHEAGACFMAQGYAMATGKPGVVLTTSGPGATNALTAVASAWQEEVPMIIVTAQNRQNAPDGGAFQDSSCTGVDILSILSHCTRYNARISSSGQLVNRLASAVSVAMLPPQGPAHLSIPQDILASAMDKKVSLFPPYRYQRREMLDLAAMTHLEALLLPAPAVVLVIGGECRHAMDSIMAFAEQTGSPVVASLSGKGLVDPYHPLFRGVVGFAGHESALKTLHDPELKHVLAIGSALDEWEIAGWNLPASIDGMIHVSEVAEHFTRSRGALLHVQGEIASVFDELLGRLGDRRNYDCRPWTSNGTSNRVNNPVWRSGGFIEALWLSEYPSASSAGDHIHPAVLMKHLSALLPANACCLADVGNSTAWSVHYLNPHFRKQDMFQRPWFAASTRFAAMGWALGNAVGVAMADRSRKVVCITGDGSLLMNGQEMTVAAEHGLDVCFVVLNDSALGMVKHGQRMTGAASIAHGLPNVDFAAMAGSLGIRGYRVVSEHQLEQCLPGVLAVKGGPVLLDVVIDPEARPPIGRRIEELLAVEEAGHE